MKAVVFHKPKDVRVEEWPDPKIEHPRDAVLRVTSTAICGSDLHIYNSTYPQLRPMVLGHEFMGVVEEVGPEVGNLSKGDRVVVPFPISCGVCFFCKRGLQTHCENSNPKFYGPEGGTLHGKSAGFFGYTDLNGGYDGGQAQYVRVPYADYGPRKVPDEVQDEEVLFLTDIFPTGFAAIDWAGLTGGETVAVFGCGPVGLMAQKSAWLKGAGRVIGLDVEQYRLDMAKEAAGSETILVEDHDGPVRQLREMTEGRGPDVCVDAVGMEAHISALRKAAVVAHMEAGVIDALKMAVAAVRRGGTVTVVGVYGTDYDNFPMGQIFDKGLTMRAGQVPVHYYIDHLLRLVLGRKVKLYDIISHIGPMDDAPIYYKVFNDKLYDCSKVVLKPWQRTEIVVEETSLARTGEVLPCPSATCSPA